MEGERFLEVIDRRWSCRRFYPAPLEDGTVRRLLEAMQRAPSAGNMQPWHFYVVRNAGLKQELVAAAYGQGFIAEAPVVFVVCAVPEKSAPRYGDRGRHLYSIQDTAAAVENLLLAVESLGLGACWVGAFMEDAAARALDLPQGRRPVAIVPVGRPAAKSTRTSRRSLRDVVTYLD
jgi:nitroreductase